MTKSSLKSAGQGKTGSHAPTEQISENVSVGNTPSRLLLSLNVSLYRNTYDSLSFIATQVAAIVRVRDLALKTSEDVALTVISAFDEQNCKTTRRPTTGTSLAIPVYVSSADTRPSGHEKSIRASM